MKRVLAVFLLLAASLLAEEDVPLIRQADAYFEAKEYDRSYELYSSLLKEKLAPWQQARLRYNLATILMWKGEAEKAAAQFAEVPYSIEETPYLARALLTNLAILNFRMARAALSSGGGGLESYSRAFFYLRAALGDVDRAEMADCRLQEVKGSSGCEMENDLKILRKAIKNQYAVVLDHFGDAKIAEASPKEGIPYLITGTNLAESHLDFLESIPEKNPLKKAYNNLFARDMQAWGLLWKSQEEKVAELASAHKAFDEGTHLLSEEKYSESRLAFLEAEAKLTELMQELWGDDPLTELLRQMLVAYQYALDQHPIQSSTLYQLVARQQQVNELAEGNLDGMEFLTFSNQQLDAALEYARKGETDSSQLYLLEARQWLLRLLRSEQPNPEEILEASLQDQVHALNLNHVLNRDENRVKDQESLLKGAQGFTLQTAVPFLEAVLEKEVREWPERCQCKPWNRVIPLFLKGETAAKLAESYLKQDPDDPQGMRKQEEAVKYWKEALHALRHPEKEEKKDDKEEKRQEEPPPPQEEGEEKQPIEEVMRQLQKMHRDDRRPASGSRQTQKGIRPW